jgi:hypothetical protein
VEEVSFWKRIAPRLAVAEAVVTVLDGRTDMVWLALVVVDSAVGVELGAGVVLGAADEGGAGAGEAPFAPALESPAGKTTTLALPPAGMVTTQKEAPPAPTACSALVTPPTPFTEGSMEQGVPTHPLPMHAILIPKFGVMLENEPVYSGFQPIL